MAEPLPELLRSDPLHAHELLARALPAHDRHAAHAHPQALGEQTAEGVVGASLHRRSADPNEQRPVAQADDLARRRARLQAHGYLGVGDGETALARSLAPF